jgi:hypothetical protein
MGERLWLDERVAGPSAAVALRPSLRMTMFRGGEGSLGMTKFLGGQGSLSMTMFRGGEGSLRMTKFLGERSLRLHG